MELTPTTATHLSVAPTRDSLQSGELDTSSDDITEGFTSWESGGLRDTSDELILTITVCMNRIMRCVQHNYTVLTCGFSEDVNTCEMTPSITVCEGCKEKVVHTWHRPPALMPTSVSLSSSSCSWLSSVRRYSALQTREHSHTIPSTCLAHTLVPDSWPRLWIVEYACDQ